jgi:hypothetical protein
VKVIIGRWETVILKVLISDASLNRASIAIRCNLGMLDSSMLPF